MALISVIVPVYKVEQYLERCVDSILCQSFSNFELVLIDDGSPDRCGEICDEYAKKDSRVIVIHQENGGLSAARDTGIDWMFENSNSEWVTFVDSDDWIHPQFLQVLYNAVTETNANVSICGFRKASVEEVYPSAEKSLVQLHNPEDFWIKDRVNATVAWGKLYRKECFSQIRYPVGKLHEDEYVTYQILFVEKSLAVTDAKLYYYFQNEEGIMQSSWDVRRLDGAWVFKEQLNFFLNRNYKKATYCAADCYVDYLVYGLIQLENSTEHKEERILLRKELRNSLRKYGKHLQILKKNKNLAYRIAYPKGFKIYQKMQRKKKHFLILYREKGIRGLWNKIRNMR